MQQQLKDLYYNPLYGFMDLNKFRKKLQEQGVNAPAKEVKDFLEKQLTWQVNKQQKIPRQFSTYWVHNIRDNYQIDIMVYDRYQVGRYKYVLCLIDVKSRYASAKALHSREMAGSVIPALREMCNEMGWPKTISADREFDNQQVKALFEAHGADPTKFQFSDPDQLHKNPIVERWHRTLAGRLQKWRVSQPAGIKHWPTVLPQIVEAYNNSYHSGIRAKPIDVWEGRDYNKKRIVEVDSSFNVGDRVRYRLDRPTFYKGDRITFSADTYVITAKTAKRFVIAKLKEDGTLDTPMSKKRAAYELARASEFEGPDVEIQEPRQRRLPKNDTNAANIQEGRRERRAPVRLDL